MEPDRQPPEELELAIGRVLEDWLVRCVVTTAESRTGACPPELVDAARRMAASAAPAVQERVARLLRTDVDEQRDNPLAVLRAAVAHPTGVLRDAGVEPARRDEFDQRAFPDDVYGLRPSTWADVDESLQEVGIMWGAWKAAIVLHRRREEGRR
jgi:hypothetical protein